MILRHAQYGPYFITPSLQRRRGEFTRLIYKEIHNTKPSPLADIGNRIFPGNIITPVLCTNHRGKNLYALFLINPIEDRPPSNP
jgi:hypothetical protein